MILLDVLNNFYRSILANHYLFPIICSYKLTFLYQRVAGREVAFAELFIYLKKFFDTERKRLKDIVVVWVAFISCDQLPSRLVEIHAHSELTKECKLRAQTFAAIHLDLKKVFGFLLKLVLLCLVGNGLFSNLDNLLLFLELCEHFVVDVEHH